MSTFDKVKEIVVSVIKVDESKVSLDAKLKDDLGADSIDAFDVITELEDAFEITIDDEKAQNIVSIGDLVAYIDELKA